MKDAVDVVIDKKEYSLRPTFAAIVSIEDKIHKSILSVAQSVTLAGSSAPLTHYEVTTIIHECMLEAGGTLTFADLGKVIYDEGIMKYLPIAIEIIDKALTPAPEKALTSSESPKSPKEG